MRLRVMMEMKPSTVLRNLMNSWWVASWYAAADHGAGEDVEDGELDGSAGVFGGSTETAASIPNRPEGILKVIVLPLYPHPLPRGEFTSME